MVNRLFWCGLLAASLGVGCLSPSPVEDPPEPIDNRAPIAVSSPGSDYPIGSTVTLSGLGSFDPDGDPLLFHWSADIPGMPDPLEGTASEFTLELQNQGPYLVDLSVEDPFGATSSTSVIVRAFIPAVEIEVNAGPVELFRQVAVQGSIDLNGTALDDQIVFANFNSATTIDLQSQAVNSVSGTLGSRLVAATNTGTKFYVWQYNNPGRVGRLTVTSTGPVFLGSHQFPADDCDPLWSSPTEQFVISACGKILRVSDDETLDLSELGDLSVTAIEAAVHAEALGLIIVATPEGDEFALRAFNDVTFEEEWVRVLPHWYTEQSSTPLRVLTPRALYMLPDGQTLLIVGYSSFSQHYLLRFKL